MKTGKGSSLKWRGLSAVCASLVAISVGALCIVNANAAFINSRLGTTNQKYVSSGESEYDSTYFESEYSGLSEIIEAKNALAEEITEEGTVLLKNENNALPLNISTEKVTLWGLNSHNPTLGGMIGSSVSLADDQTYYDIETAFTEKGFSLNQTMIDLYSSDDVAAYGRTATGHALTPSFGPIYENPTTYNIGEAPASIYTDEVLKSADDTVAVIVLSRDSSEAADYEVGMTTGTEDSYERPLALSDYEKDMIALAKEHSTKVIVMINASNAIEIDDLKNDEEIDSIVWVGEPGAVGFLGVADVLSGEVNPSGHMVDTYAVNSASSPAMVNFGVYTYTNSSKSGASDAMDSNNKSDWFVVEGEDIYVGYKYYETRYEDSILGQGNAASNEGSSNGTAWNYATEVTYPFGYGLSYTTFDQTLDSVEVNVGGDSTATVTVTNSGDVAGKSVAQLYVQSPYTEGGLEKSAIQLVGYAKTDILQPGESATLTIDFDCEYFASYDETAVKADGTTGAWVLESGDYYFAIGNGAHEALNNILAVKIGSTDTLVTTAETDVIDEAKVTSWSLATTDIETYSAGVSNELDDMDINNLIEGTVEYTTRSDWTKGWDTIATLTPTDEMMVGLNNKIYELTENGEGTQWGVDSGLTIFDALTLDSEGNIAEVKSLDDEFWDKLIAQMTLDEAIQFIEKGGDDVENVDSILLTRTYANDGPLGFTYDQVGGYYIRWQTSNADEPTYITEADEYSDYSMATMPTDPVVAATMNAELQAREGALFAEDGLWSNETSLFAPGVNIHRTPYCARNHEYYSEDSILTSLTAVAVVDAAEEKGLMMEPKHFAFNHQESNRSGISTFINEQGARENELRCFQKLMSENHCSGIMTAFNRAGTKFVGAYENLLIGIARNEWGYEGWYNTDMINGADYMNWRDITFAGGGNCLTTSAYDTSKIGNMASSKSKIVKDTAFQNMMKYNIRFWLYKLASSNALNGISVDTKIVNILTWYQILCITLIAVFGVGTVGTAFLGFKKYKEEK
ncbi:MAG: glycoside hydrolase family 3 C-terminal domain-containing protein [Butyrivibrio sp.]|nr:glycoside hydrolase family 3 C-terminal domain-containing protein [Butyrivibrio sp.]